MGNRQESDMLTIYGAEYIRHMGKTPVFIPKIETGAWRDYNGMD